jgi:hypothetical protein
MGGGGKKPGEVYKFKVTDITGLVVTFEGHQVSGTLTVPAADVSYFEVGKEYVSFYSPYCGDYSGMDSSTASEPSA